MSGRSGWVLLGLLALAAAALVLLQRGVAADSPNHSSYSDGRNGTSALRQYAEQLGHPTRSLDGDFNLPSEIGTLFVFNPAGRFQAEEVASLRTWLERGGTVVYADDALDRRLAVAFDLRTTSFPVPSDGYPATPALVGVKHITTGAYGRQYLANPGQAVLLRAGSGSAAVIEEKVGSGRLIAVASPQVLANGWLERADNAIFAADLLSITPGPVIFDEFHHGTGAGLGRRGDWTRGPLGIGLFWGALAIFLALLVRGRSFGPRLRLNEGGPRSTAEYTSAVGHLLRLAGGRSLALQVLAETARRRISQRIGVGADLPLPRLEEILARRSPALGREFADATRAAQIGSRSELALLVAARKLHDLAYPQTSVTPKENQ